VDKTLADAEQIHAILKGLVPVACYVYAFTRPFLSMATSCGISHLSVHSCYSPDVVAHRSVPYPHIPCKTKRMLLAVSTHRLCKQCGVDCFHEYTNYAGVFVHAFVRTCAGLGRDSSSLNPKLSQASCAFTDVDVNAGRCRPVGVPGKQVQLILRLHTYIYLLP
jgi:hypothetical protein